MSAAQPRAAPPRPGSSHAGSGCRAAATATLALAPWRSRVPHPQLATASWGVLLRCGPPRPAPPRLALTSRASWLAPASYSCHSSATSCAARARQSHLAHTRHLGRVPPCKPATLPAAAPPAGSPLGMAQAAPYLSPRPAAGLPSGDTRPRRPLAAPSPWPALLNTYLGPCLAINRGYVYICICNTYVYTYMYIYV